MVSTRLTLATGALAAVTLLGGCSLLEPALGGRPVDEGCTVRIPEGDSVAERVVALREIGLFAGRAELSDQALAAEVEETLRERWTDPDDMPGWLLELAVAAEDLDRVWWQDLEADVGAGGDVYVDVLDAWAAISAGAFQPTDIEETWVSDEGPVALTFMLDGERQIVGLTYQEDWIDLDLVGKVNHLIAVSDRRFAVFEPFDQTAFVMALTPEEQALLTMRGWCIE